MKRKTYINAVVITWLAVIAIALVNMGYYNSPQKLISADFANVDYKLPELAPIKERTQVISLIKQVWGKDAHIGLAIARAESGYRTTARNFNTNGTVDEGVFQVNSVHGMTSMSEPVANVSYAYTIYLKQGTAPWNSSKAAWEKAI